MQHITPQLADGQPPCHNPKLADGRVPPCHLTSTTCHQSHRARRSCSLPHPCLLLRTLPKLPDLQVVMIPIVKKEADKAAVMESISQLESAARAAGIRVKVGLLLHLFFCCFVCVCLCVRVCVHGSGYASMCECAIMSISVEVHTFVLVCKCWFLRFNKSCVNCALRYTAHRDLSMADILSAGCCLLLGR